MSFDFDDFTGCAHGMHDDHCMDFGGDSAFGSAGDIAFDHPGSPDDFHGSHFIFEDHSDSLHAEDRGFSSAFNANDVASRHFGEEDFRILSGTGAGDEGLNLGRDLVFWVAGEDARGTLSGWMDALWSWMEKSARR